MPRYILLLRGINVAQNSLKMDRLKSLLNDFDFRNIRTYLQSGNAVFDAPAKRTAWAPQLTERMKTEARRPIDIFVRTADEMKRISQQNPFSAEAKKDGSKVHITFLTSAPSPPGVARLTAINAGRDRFSVGMCEIYLHCPDGYGRSKLANSAIERALSQPATTRNFNTIAALCDLAAS